MLWVRNVRDRVEKLAPFLSYDGDPYPVVLDGHVLLGDRRLHVDQPLPLRRGGGQRHPSQREQRHPARRQLRAQLGEGGGRRLRRLGAHVRRRRQRPDRAGVVSRCSRRCSRRRARCRPGSASTCAIRRTCSGCRRTCTRSTSSQPEDFFERDGAWSVAQAPAVVARSGAVTAAATAAASATVTAADDTPPNELATESSNDRFIPYYTMFGDERDFVLLRPFVPFSRDDQRTAAAGVHDRVERPVDVRPAHRLRRRRHRRPAGGPAHDRQLGGGDARHQRADHAAEPGRRPGSLRRPPAGADPASGRGRRRRACSTSARCT